MIFEVFFSHSMNLRTNNKITIVEESRTHTCINSYIFFTFLPSLLNIDVQLRSSEQKLYHSTETANTTSLLNRQMGNFPSYNMATKATDVKAAKAKLMVRTTVSTQPLPPNSPQVQPTPELPLVSVRGGDGKALCFWWYCCPCCLPD
jgi:hypothetical protein